MATETISIEVDTDTARVFSEASAVEQHKLQFLLALRLRELMTGLHRPLSEIMDDIGSRAEQRRLSPEILESMLHDE